MEKAIVLYCLSDISDSVLDYDRLYFGSEFCQLHLPDDNEVEKIIKIAQRGKKKLSFLTPICNDLGVERIDYILKKYGELLFRHDFEVVINDWGILDLMNLYPDAKKVVGRSLLNYKKDPRIAKLSSIPEELKYNEAQSPFVIDFLGEYNCGRIEFDNLGYLLEGLTFSDKFDFSVYVPYVCVTTTRLCRMQDENLYDTSNALKPHLICDRKCEKYKMELRNDSVGQNIIVRGNTQYFKTTEFSEEWYESRGINRIVYDDLSV